MCKDQPAIIRIDAEEINELFHIPDDLQIIKFEQPVWCNISQQWLFEFYMEEKEEE